MEARTFRSATYLWDGTATGCTAPRWRLGAVDKLTYTYDGTAKGCTKAKGKPAAMGRTVRQRLGRAS